MVDSNRFTLTLIFISSFSYCFLTGDKCQQDYRSCSENDPIKCVPDDWWCDGHSDCEFGLDEANCSTQACHETEVRCKSGRQCISKFLRCDGKPQCIDQSDEEDCPPTDLKTCDPLHTFDCNGDGNECIALSKVCDGSNDCGRNQDEQPGGSANNCQRNDCRLIENGGCSHFCTNIYTKAICHCPPEYQLENDLLNCVDIDECTLIPARCSQVCNNTLGSYHCLCKDGYKLHQSIPGECIAKDGDRSGLVTLDNGEIVIFNLENDKKIIHNINISANSWADIDVHVGQDSKITIFWSHLKNKNIGETVIKRKPGSSDLFEVISQSEIFQMHNSSFCAGLTYDWLRSLLFWTSTQEPQIYVTNTTSKKTSILLTKGLESPRSIVADPFETRLYWIDWGNKSSSARIETMLMNTEDRRIIVKSGLRQPMGITIDFLDRRLYWSDINPGSIVFIDLNRPMIRKIVISNRQFHPFTVSIFENKAYWSDWRQNQIISVGKTVGDNIKIIFKVSKPMSINIINQLTNPPLPSNNSLIHTCLNTQSQPCLDICLPSPPSTNRQYTNVKCVCSDTHVAFNTRDCISGSGSLVLPKNINRLTIIAAVMISLAVIMVLFASIILLYFCRKRLCTRSCKRISRQGFKHPVINGDLMFIFKCHSHSSQMSELLSADFNSLSNA